MTRRELTLENREVIRGPTPLIAAESALAADWLTPEEDEAWTTL